MKRIILGETHDILKVMPVDQLKFFYEIRMDEKKWKALTDFVLAQKQVKLDAMYRLRRPKSQDDIVHNAVEHEYYAGRIASDVILLQIAENAGDELERRERTKSKK